MARSLHTTPKTPKVEPLRSAYFILKYTHEATKSFLDSFEKVRKARKAKGTPTDEEQDLLRAMLLFAASGLDATIKQLVRHTLSLVVESDIGARQNLQKYAERRCSKANMIPSQEHSAAKFLAAIMTHDSPKRAVIEHLVSELTSSSLQSKDQLFRAASHFGIKASEIVTDDSLLDGAFHARNQIAHEMDIDFKQPNRNRVPRRRDDMVQYANILLDVGDGFLAATEKRIRPIMSR